MSALGPGDEALHYEDGSHRWSPPDSRIAPQVWEARVRDHQRRHREALGPAPAPRPGRSGRPPN